MKLRHLEIKLLPGIDDRFVLEDFGDGMNVVLGPNGIGKSSLARAMQALLWRDGAKTAQVIASARFESSLGEYTVQRDASSLRWQLGDANSDGPSLPDFNLAPCFFLGLRDLLDIASRADGHVADSIRKEMSGGYRLETVASLFTESVALKRAKKASKSLAEAQNRLQKARRDQEILEQKEASLKQLNASIDGASKANARVARIAEALDVLKDREQLAECAARLAQLPKALESLTGAEPDKLDQNQKDLESKARELDDVRRAQTAAQAKAAETGLDSLIEDTLLFDAKARVADLQGTQVRLDQAESDWRGAQNAAAEASQRLGGAPDSMVTLDLQDADRLFDFLREAEDQSAQLKRVEKQIEELHTNEESDGRVTTTQLQRGIDELRLWLRSPDPVRVAAATAPSDQPAWIPILCLVLVLIGFALGYFVHPALFAIAGLGIGWMLPRTARNSDAERTQDSTENARAKAEAQFDLEAPAAWTEPEVAKHLRQIEDRLVELLLADRQSNSTKERLRSLQVEQDSLLKFNGTLSERRTDLAKQLGLQQIPPDAQLVNMARSMDQLRKAQQAELAAAGKLESIRAQQADLLARLADSLSPIAKTAPKDAASAHAIVESLAQRNADLRSALHDQKQATERIQSLEKECQTLTDRSQSILQNAGVADRSEFDALISHLGAYRSDLEKHRDLLTAIQRVETKLRAAGEESLLEMALEPLNAESKRAQESADSLEALSQQKAEIQGKIERAREDHEIEEGLSLKDEILAELESLRDDALFGAAGQFLLNTVTKEHAYESMPKVFEDARRLFADFTQQRYNLHVHDEHEQSFFAVETATKQRRNLDELSDGTRIQLALAARLAFVKQAEQGTPLPLFLDEALDHSDSERFHAIASSLAKMVVDEGRQIFYLTSDPTDIERLQRAFSECGAGQVHEINLAVARGQGTKIETAEQLTIAPLAQVPEPGSLSAEQYGARIKVPQFDPRKGAAGTHLFYLLSDDLEALHRLLNLPIESAGQWLNLNDVKAHVATALVDQSPTIAELASRIALLDEFCEQRLIGRGKPLDLAVLEASEALTANSLEKVPQLARDLENDASALIEVLRNRGPHELAKGFPRKQTEALEAYLLEEGFIDPRSPRSESELNDRVLTIPAAAKLPANSRRDLLHMWWSLTEAESADRPA